MLHKQLILLPRAAQLGTLTMSANDTSQYIDVDLTVRFVTEKKKSFLLTDRLNDKRLFVMIEFINAYPTSKVENYAELLLLINSNNAIQKWYKEVTARFATYSESPSWLLEDPKLQDVWKSNFQSLYNNYRDQRNVFQSQRENIQRTIELQLENLDESESQFDLDFYKQNPVLLINNISVQSLPFEITEKYLKLSTKDRKDSLKREVDIYKRQLFTSYLKGDLKYEDLYNIVK
jgi:hypothetical protein